MAYKMKVFADEDELREGEVFAKVSKRVSVGTKENDYYSHVESETRISVGAEGSLVFSDNDSGEGFIYFYPDQLGHVKEALDAAMKQRGQAKA